MFKWILFFIVFILLISGSFAGYLYTNREEFLSKWLTGALGTKVSIHAIDIKNDGFTISGLAIKNPPSCSLKNAFSADRIDVQLNWKQQLPALFGIQKQAIVIDKIAIDNPELGIEVTSLLNLQTNWKTIIDNITPTSSPSPAKDSRSFIVKKCVLTHIQMNVTNDTLVPLSLHPAPIASIEMNNIGSDKARSLSEVLYSIFKRLSEEAVSHATGDTKPALPSTGEYKNP